jgi:predicted MFS family arabinose efflux permease
MPTMDGAVQGRPAGRPLASRSGRPLDRLAWVHAASTCGDALVAVALAGTLFFAVPVAAARPRVALYLLLTVAPFAVVAPLLGRLLDGRSGAGRVALATALALRVALAALTVTRTQSLLLYPLAFGLLVCSRAHGICRTAMVPELLPGPVAEGSGQGGSGAEGVGREAGEGSRRGGVGRAGGPGEQGSAGDLGGTSGAGRPVGRDARDLVAVNGRMARVAALGGTVGALLGVGLDRLLGGGSVLWASALVFATGTALALSLPATRRHRDPVPAVHRQSGPRPRRDQLDRRAARLARPPGRVRLARTANTGVRAVGGFTLFLLAFELRRQGVGTAGLGLLLAAVGIGGVVGAFLLPRAARLVREDGLLAGGLLLCGTTAWLLAGRVGLESAAAGGLAMGAGIAAARLGFESLVQREVPAPARGTAITRAETTFQLAWVAGAVLPVAFPLPTTPSLLAAAAVCLLAATTYTVGLLRLRRRRDRQPA